MPHRNRTGAREILSKHDSNVIYDPLIYDAKKRRSAKRSSHSGDDASLSSFAKVDRPFFHVIAVGKGTAREAAKISVKIASTTELSDPGGAVKG